MSARESILARVRAALADVPDSEKPDDVAIPRDYRRSSDLAGEQVLDLFAENVADYGATVHRIRPDDLTVTLAEICRQRRVHTLVAPPGFPEQVVTGAGAVLMRDGPPMSAASLDRADGVVTTAALGIAETGTIALVTGPGMGRRALSLVPDVHVCLVRHDQVVATVPEAMDVLSDSATEPITLISGGSATSDIELVRVQGVHGPRVLHVIIVESGPDT